MKVTVIGAGPGASDLYTDRMKEAVLSADLVLTAERLAEPLRQLIAGREQIQNQVVSASGAAWENRVLAGSLLQKREADPKMTEQAAADLEKVRIMGVTDTVAWLNERSEEGMTVCVAASGDTGFYSIASTLKKRLHPNIQTEFLCGIGSLSYFAAKLKTGYEDMKLISLHGRKASIVPYVCYNRKVFALTGGSLRAHHIAGQLLDAGLTEVTVRIGEHLSEAGERIVSGKPAELAEMEFDDLAVVVVENENYVNRYKILKDSDFVRGKSPMTKEAIRNLSVAALEIAPSDVVYDIGAGTGSVTCAMALKACESTVYGVEKNPEAVKLVRENMEKTGARNILIKEGLAPVGMEDFPPADKVFIGGSTGNLKEIMETVLKRSETAVFVITAVTLETISQATAVCREMNLETEITCVNISSAQKLGRYHLMQAENPVYIIKGRKYVQ